MCVTLRRAPWQRERYYEMWRRSHGEVGLPIR